MKHFHLKKQQKDILLKHNSKNVPVISCVKGSSIVSSSWTEDCWRQSSESAAVAPTSSLTVPSSMASAATGASNSPVCNETVLTALITYKQTSKHIKAYFFL